MKVVDFIKIIKEKGYDENTEINFAVISLKHGKGVLFEVEDIVSEKDYGNENENTITIDFDDNLVDIIKKL